MGQVVTHTTVTNSETAGVELIHFQQKQQRTFLRIIFQAGRCEVYGKIFSTSTETSITMQQCKK